MEILLPSEAEIRRLYMAGYTVKQIIKMVYSFTAKVMKKDVAHYVEIAISTYHYWEDKEEQHAESLCLYGQMQQIPDDKR